MKQLPRCYAVLWAFSLLLLSARLSAQAGLLEKVEIWLLSIVMNRWKQLNL